MKFVNTEPFERLNVLKSLRKYFCMQGDKLENAFTLAYFAQFILEAVKCH